MLAVTDRFKAAVRDSHTVSVAASVFRPSAPTVPIEVQLLGGELTIDRDARVRRQARLEVAFALTDEQTPAIVRELPFGGYATVERGIRYANGETERVKLGRFRVDAVSWGELQGQASLTLNDRMAQIQDEPFAFPYSPAGLKPSDAVVAIVQEVFGATIAYKVTTTPAAENTLADVVYDQDRAAAISDLAANINAEAFFDQLGDFVLRPRPAPTVPVWTIDAAPEGVLVAATENLDRSVVRNGVAVRGQDQATQAPIYALATDNDPASVTRWGGPFGKVALIVASTTVQTQAQADSTAASLLNLRLGLARNLTIQSVPNPALEPGDLIELVHADGRSETQTINAVRLGFGPDSPIELVTTGHYRPEVFAKVIRVFSGATAWRELAPA